MKKSSLLAIAAASLVGLASCGPAAPVVYTSESVCRDVAAKALQKADPVKGTDYRPYGDEWICYELGGNVDPTAEHPYLDLLNAVHARVKEISYLEEAYAPTIDPSEEAEYVTSRFVTNDASNSIWVDFEAFEPSDEQGKLYWQCSVYENPYKEGFPSGEFIAETLEFESAFEVPAPVFPAGAEYEMFYKADSAGARGNVVYVTIDGLNLATAYGQLLTSEANEYVLEPDPFNDAAVYHDKDSKVVVTVYGESADPEVAGSSAETVIVIFDYEKFHAEIDPPATFDEFVCGVANEWLSEPIESADEIYNPSTGKYGFYFDLELNTNPEATVNSFAGSLPAYMYCSLAPENYDAGSGATGAYGIYYGMLSSTHAYQLVIQCFGHPSVADYNFINFTFAEIGA